MKRKLILSFFFSLIAISVLVGGTAYAHEQVAKSAWPGAAISKCAPDLAICKGAIPIRSAKFGSSGRHGSSSAPAPDSQAKYLLRAAARHKHGQRKPDPLKWFRCGAPDHASKKWDAAISVDTTEPIYVVQLARISQVFSDEVGVCDVVKNNPETVRGPPSNLS